MASMTASTFAARPASISQRPAARSRVIMCSAQKQEQRQQPSKMARVAAAGLAAIFIAASPAFAAETESGASLKAKLCATNPTAKICLRDSIKK